MIRSAKKIGKLIVLVLILFSLSGPVFLSGYWIRLLTFIFMWIGLAGSLNIITGYTGYLDFGHIVFFGSGAYVTGILMVKLGIPFPLALMGGALFATLIAMVIGIPTMRLRGAYFAIAMLAFSEAMKQLTFELKSITGGGNGISLPIYTNYTFFYYAMFSAMLAVILATLWIEKSKFGYGLKAIREAEVAAEVSGVSTIKCKLLAFSISAFTAGAIGGIYAYWMTFFYPSDVFDVLLTVEMIIMAFLGGAGTVLGPIIGATFLHLLSEFLWSHFVYSYLIIVGVVLVIVVLFMPQGILGLMKKGLILVSERRGGP